MSDSVNPPVQTDAAPSEIKIDDKTYKLEDLSAEAQGQLRNIQEIDRKLVAAQNEINSLQTWRVVHSHSLKQRADTLLPANNYSPMASISRLRAALSNYSNSIRDSGGRLHRPTPYTI